MTDEELIEAGGVLCKAYYLGNGYAEHDAVQNANSLTIGSNWVKQAKALAEAGHHISGSAVPVAGQKLTGAALLRSAEQLAENVRVTLESVEKQPEQKPKAVAQWRFALNCFFGATHKRGLIPDLKDAGPDAY